MTLRPAAVGAAALLSVLALLPPLPAVAQEPAPLDRQLLSDFRFRSVGPAGTGGRIHDVEALPDDPSTLYVATASGGLWKSTNQGTTWTPLFDDRAVSTFGDVALAPSDPSILYAGTGEQQNRQSTSWGNGVYRSGDSGESWTHLGLEETRHIGRVLVHPGNPDVAWVAAQGNLWAGGRHRGVYRTTDGGESWEKVLAGENRFTGAVDLALSPGDPDVIYAAMYQRLRRTWGFNGGGPGSGIWKSTDGGDSWRELSDGLPGGEKGRIGIDVSPADPDRVYALVQHADSGGTYRSDDAGESWSRVNSLNPRPMYYSHVVADPVDPDRVYVLATEFYTSADGGRTFRQMPTRPTYDVGVHSDHHSLWIDPGDPEHFYLAGDAGLHESFDRGETYRNVHNLPIGQFYAIGLDRRDPYRIYGGMQDNHSWVGPSATRRWKGILDDDWKQIGFGDGMYQQPDPTSHRFVYVGSQNGGITRVDATTGDRLEIRPRAPVALLGAPGDSVRGDTRDEEAADPGDPFRFDWVTPSLVSRHDPTTFYLGGNRLFVTRDRGVTWAATEDLTKEIDRDTLELMGVEGSAEMLSKHDGTASFSEITTIAESPLDPDVLWVGTDDGNVQVSRDGGRSWSEVGRNVPGVAPTVYVSRVTASAAAPGVAYVAFDAHRRGDFGSHLFRTRDFGRSWSRIDGDLPADAGPVNDVVEHPDRPGLLFAGTEHGLFVSPDAGRRWTPLGANLPTTLYDDLAIHPREKDLVAGTHGRSIWVLDDTGPLARWTRSAAGAPARLFPPREAELFHYWKSTSYRGQMPFAGENPPFGALLTYHLSEPADDARITVRNAGGDTVRRLEVDGEAGVLHRVTWDLRHTPPPTEGDDEEEGQEVGELVQSDTVLPPLSHPLEPSGPLVSPGVYTLVLTAGDARSSTTLRVVGDPEMSISDEDWHTREEFLVELLSLQRRAHRSARRARDLAASRSGEGTSGEPGDAGALAERLGEIRDGLYGLAGAFNRSGVTQGSLHPPTETHRRQRERLAERLESARAELERLEAGGD
jgi:photosystem II stability/assembly factor-like uncharacterized protein